MLVAAFPLQWRAGMREAGAAIGVVGGGEQVQRHCAPRLARSWLPLCQCCAIAAVVGEFSADNCNSVLHIFHHFMPCLPINGVELLNCSITRLIIEHKS
jgi:hypothetical protein